MIRWWNAGRYERECAREASYLPWILGPHPGDPSAIRAVTESGLQIWVKLHINFPMHIGVAYL